MAVLQRVRSLLVCTGKASPVLLLRVLTGFWIGRLLLSCGRRCLAHLCQCVREAPNFLSLMTPEKAMSYPHLDRRGFRTHQSATAIRPIPVPFIDANIPRVSAHPALDNLLCSPGYPDHGEPVYFFQPLLLVLAEVMAAPLSGTSEEGKQPRAQFGKDRKNTSVPRLRNERSKSCPYQFSPQHTLEVSSV